MRESAVRRAPDLAEADGLDVTTRSRVRPNAPVLALLALGHLVIDTNQGALPPSSRSSSRSSGSPTQRPAPSCWSPT